MLAAPDSVYWRRMRYGEPEILYIRAENLHYWPGEGPCVDGFFYWVKKGHNIGDPNAIVKRIPLEVWRQWGYQKHSPPEEKPKHLKKHPYSGYRSRRSKEQLRLGV